jgi:long-chain acyl-CoA synthetase
MTDSLPWLRFYGSVPPTLEYPTSSLYQVVMNSVRRVPDAIAYEFLGYQSTYREFGDAIGQCAAALAALGLRQGDRITISMPTSPQGVIAFYAAIRLGAVPSMIHPLSTAPEIEFYLRVSQSRFALTLDAFYGRFAEVRDRTPLETLILARIPDYLSPLKRLGFWLTRGRKIPPVPPGARVHWWRHLMSHDYPEAPVAVVDTNSMAAILYSGGTTGSPKGIMLSHRNFISEGMQVAAWGNLRESDRVLAVLPIFHGFGLSALVNAALMGGAQAIMVPLFSAEAVAKLMRTHRPTIIAGVPTLFDALSRDPSLKRADLSSIRAAFSGADTLPRPVKERFEALVQQQGGKVRLLEGYGLTEAVTAIMATPLDSYREGSVGVPFPDILAKVCRPGTEEEVPTGEEGEICVSGPPVMLGYLDEPAATAETLRTHRDGLVWLHTGDLGRMDQDGFFYFVTRLKRMIKSSGFNVYPAQVEAVLYQHPAVLEACVIGVPDPAQGERVKAVVVLRDPGARSQSMVDELIAHCQKQLIKWSCPREVEFRSDLPRTRIGKIDFKTLVDEEKARIQVTA